MSTTTSRVGGLGNTGSKHLIQDHAIGNPPRPPCPRLSKQLNGRPEHHRWVPKVRQVLRTVSAQLGAPHYSLGTHLKLLRTRQRCDSGRSHRECGGGFSPYYKHCFTLQLRIGTHCSRLIRTWHWNARLRPATPDDKRMGVDGHTSLHMA